MRRWRLDHAAWAAARRRVAGTSAERRGWRNYRRRQLLAVRQCQQSRPLRPELALHQDRHGLMPIPSTVLPAPAVRKDLLQPALQVVCETLLRCPVPTTVPWALAAPKAAPAPITRGSQVAAKATYAPPTSPGVQEVAMATRPFGGLQRLAVQRVTRSATGPTSIHSGLQEAVAADCIRQRRRIGCNAEPPRKPWSRLAVPP